MDNSDVRKARALARALDAAVGVPGTPIRIGLDAILGIIPGAGDMVGAVLSGYIVLIAVRRGAPQPMIWRMLANIGIDTVLGSVPIVGDLFDVAYKSNIRNVELLERHSAEPAQAARSSRRFTAVVVLILVAIVAALGALGFFAARLVWRLLAS